MKPFSRSGLRFLLSNRKVLFAASYTGSTIHLNALSNILMKQLKNLLLLENTLSSWVISTQIFLNVTRPLIATTLCLLFKAVILSPQLTNRAQSLLLTLGALVPPGVNFQAQFRNFRRTVKNSRGIASNTLARMPTPKDQKYTPKRATLKRATRASCSNRGHLFQQYLRQ